MEKDKTQIYLVVASVIGFIIVGWSLIYCFQMLPFYLTIFVVITVLTAAAAAFPIRRLPQGEIVSAKEILTAFALASLGVEGATLVSALYCYLALSGHISKNRAPALIKTTFAVITVFLAGRASFMLLGVVVPFDYKHLLDTPWQIYQLLIFLTFYTVLHFVLNSLLEMIYVRLTEAENLPKAVFLERFKKAAGGLAIGVLIAAMMVSVAAAYTWEATFFAILVPAAVYLVTRFSFGSLTAYVHTLDTNGSRQLAMIEALASAIDARDQMSQLHVKRVQFFACRLAEIIGLGEEDIQHLKTAALFHSLGKLAVPDYILNKPGKLTESETEKLKIYPSISAGILRQVSLAEDVVRAVLHHRESWNGDGYPEGLRGDEIPLLARVLALTVAYDSMCEDRPFRKRLKREDARRVILSESGTRFDPRITDVFLRHLAQIETEFEESLQTAKDAESISLPANRAAVRQHEIGNLVNVQRNYFEHIRNANREVYALYDLARVFSGTLDLKGTVDLFVEKVRELVPLDTCTVYLYEEKTKNARSVRAVGRNAAFLNDRVIQLGDGTTGNVLLKREAVYNVSPASDFPGKYKDIATEYSAMASLPLVADDRLIGAVSVYSGELMCYDDDHMRLLDTISRIAANALSKILRHNETESRALTDQMTGLPNARALQTHFEKETARVSRTNESFHVIMLDLDDFKKVNDTFGHKAGDTVLCEVSKIMREQLREYDFLARYAGDEFVAVVPNLTEEQVGFLCHRLEKAVLSYRLNIDNLQTAKVGISIGISSYPADGSTIDQVLIRADMNMYHDKATNKPKRKAIQDAQENIEQNEKAPEFIVLSDDAHEFLDIIN